MKYNLYDFDGTIYDGDSSVDFFKYCQKKQKIIKIKYLSKIINRYFKYKLKKISITEFKEVVFSYLNKIDNIEALVKEFWKVHEKRIKDFYLNQDHSNDIIISASPEFLLKPICQKLKVKDLIASDVNPKTGKFNKENNRGEVKVKVFKEKYPKAKILTMYSDSMHDKPLLDIAEKSFIVKKNKIYDYKEYKPNIIKRIWDKCWDIYHKNEQVMNYLIIGALTTLISIITYALFTALNIHYVISNVLSWIFAVLFAYFANRIFVFRSNEKNKLKEFTKFISSRLLTLLIDTLLMVLLVDVIKINDLVAKISIQVIIIILNYILSKLIVFKTK